MSHRLARVRSFLNALFRRSRLEQHMDSELQAHIEIYTADLIRAGLPRDQAELRARAEFGSREAVKEQCREARGLRWPDEFCQDLRYASRTVRKAPGFTLAAVLSLALGIGANTAIYSIVDAAFLRPLPYRDPARLIAIYENHTTRAEKFEDLANANFVDLSTNLPAVEDLAAHRSVDVLLTGGNAERLQGRYVSGNMFTLLGVRAALGRTLLPDDGNLNRPDTVLLSYDLWSRKFAADPAIVGRVVTLDGQASTVIGVMPASFVFPGAHDELWRPLRFNARDLGQRSNHNLLSIGRLKTPSGLQEAQAQASFLARWLQLQYPEDNAGIDFYVVPLRGALTRNVDTALVLLMATVALLLLIACANVGNLILTRSTVRRREFAVRAALGAGRFRLVRQLLAETLLLSSLGGMVALALALALTGVFRTYLPPALEPAGDIRIDAGVLGFGLLVSVVCGFLCALAPALLMITGQLQDSLAGSARSMTVSGGEVRTRALLVTAEVALTFVLLIGAGLLLRSFVRVMDSDSGLQPGRVLAVRFVVPSFLYASHGARVSFYTRLLERIEALPGVQSGALITSSPLTGEGGSSWFIREGRPTAHPEELIARNRLVSGSFFTTLGIPLRQGRIFSSHDGPNSPLVAVINETMARRFWPGESPIGKRFQFYSKPWVEIVGIVGDVRQLGLDRDPQPEVYRPLVQDTQEWLAPRAILVRTRTEPLSLAPAVRQQFQALDPSVAIYGLDTMDALLDNSVASRRLELSLITAFASLALLLACIGIYGVVAYVVALRKQEIGIRMALGARRGDVVAMMLRSGLRPVLWGLCIGLVLAFVLSRFLASQLYHVTATDAFTYVAAPVFLLLLGAVAAWLPSWKAARVDPMFALRQD